MEIRETSQEDSDSIDQARIYRSYNPSRPQSIKANNASDTVGKNISFDSIKPPILLTPKSSDGDDKFSIGESVNLSQYSFKH